MICGATGGSPPWDYPDDPCSGATGSRSWEVPRMRASPTTTRWVFRLGPSRPEPGVPHLEEPLGAAFTPGGPLQRSTPMQEQEDLWRGKRSRATALLATMHKCGLVSYVGDGLRASQTRKSSAKTELEAGTGRPGPSQAPPPRPSSWTPPPTPKRPPPPVPKHDPPPRKAPPRNGCFTRT